MPPARKVGALPGAGIRYGAWDWASTLNSAGTSFMNFWKVTDRSSWKVARSSPTATSYPSCACSRIASLTLNASTRVVLPLNTVGPTVNSMKSLYWLVGEPRKKYIRPAELAGMSRYGCSAIECTWPLKLQYTWLSGYLPLVRLSTLTVRTLCAAGMVLGSPQKVSGGGDVGPPGVRTANSPSREP